MSTFCRAAEAQRRGTGCDPRSEAPLGGEGCDGGTTRVAEQHLQADVTNQECHHGGEWGQGGGEADIRDFSQAHFPFLSTDTTCSVL